MQGGELRVGNLHLLGQDGVGVIWIRDWLAITQPTSQPTYSVVSRTVLVDEAKVAVLAIGATGGRLVGPLEPVHADDGLQLGEPGGVVLVALGALGLCRQEKARALGVGQPGVLFVENVSGSGPTRGR